ncbi:MAG TPA: SDR family oxidoreductase, partial [Aggregatilineales bacterium]|nr:SDR family oxidoreductase [Aggregatilineales bacterium]
TIESSGFDNYPEEIQKQLPQFRQFIPAKRFGSESEVAALVTFLLSPAANYITGETIWIDGGNSLWSSPYPIEDHDGYPPAFDGFDTE